MEDSDQLLANYNDIPCEIVLYVYDYLDTINIILAGYTCSRWYHASKYILDKQKSINMLEYACRHGYKNIFIYLESKGEIIDWEVFEGAEEYFIRTTDISMITLINDYINRAMDRSKSTLLFRLWPGRAASRIGGKNSIKVLDELCKMGYLPSQDLNDDKHIGVKILEDICILACRYGNINVLQWFYNRYKKLVDRINKYISYEVFIVTCLYEAASSGHVRILNMLYGIFKVNKHDLMDDAGIHYVPGIGNIRSVPKKHHYKVVSRYVDVHRKNSLDMTLVPCRIYGRAMHNGNIPVLKWYLDHILNGFYAAEFRAAAKHNHIDVLEWGLRTGLLGYATKKDFPKYFVNTAVRRSNWELLAWVEKKMNGKNDLISRFAFTTAVKCDDAQDKINHLLNLGWKVPTNLYLEAVVGYRDDDLIYTLDNLYKFMPPSKTDLCNKKIYKRVLKNTDDRYEDIADDVLAWLQSHGFSK